MLLTQESKNGSTLYTGTMIDNKGNISNGLALLQFYLLPHPHDLFDNGGHVVVFVFGEAATEDDGG